MHLSIRRALPLFAALALFGTGTSRVRAQSPDQRGEVVLDVPEYQNRPANAPVPVEMHLRNEGGSDGSGLCVVASTVINGEYQGIPGIVGEGKESALWRTAKSRPGGYYPKKLAQLVDEVMPNEKYAQYETVDPAILSKLSAQGYAIGATMNTGALYGYKPIHHMISLIHHEKDKYACVVDNNDPGKYHWMPTKEFDKRWIDGGTGWAFVWTRLPEAPGQQVAWLLLGLAVCVVAIARKHQTAPNTEAMPP